MNKSLDNVLFIELSLFTFIHFHGRYAVCNMTA
jgi:hypothetical protein